MKTYELILPSCYVKPVLILDFPWIKELRNPENKQTTRTLKDNLGECCLGLASRLQGRIIKDHITGSYTDGEILPDFRDTTNNLCLNLTNPLSKFIGQSGEFGSSVCVKVTTSSDFPTKIKQTYTTLAGCNDAGLTFPQIADIILAIWDVKYTNPEHQH